jgi:hypothetical protein
MESCDEFTLLLETSVLYHLGEIEAVYKMFRSCEEIPPDIHCASSVTHSKSSAGELLQIRNGSILYENVEEIRRLSW